MISDLRPSYKSAKIVIFCLVTSFEMRKMKWTYRVLDEYLPRWVIVNTATRVTNIYDILSIHFVEEAKARASMKIVKYFDYFLPSMMEIHRKADYSNWV